MRWAPWAAVVAALGISAALAVPQVRPETIDGWVADNLDRAGIAVLHDGRVVARNNPNARFPLGEVADLLPLTLYAASAAAGQVDHSVYGDVAAKAAQGHRAAVAVIVHVVGAANVTDYARNSLGMPSQDPVDPAGVLFYPGPQGTPADWARLLERLRTSRSPYVRELGLGRMPATVLTGTAGQRALVAARCDEDTSVVVFLVGVPGRFGPRQLDALVNRWLDDPNEVGQLAAARPPVHDAYSAA